MCYVCPYDTFACQKKLSSPPTNTTTPIIKLLRYYVPNLYFARDGICGSEAGEAGDFIGDVGPVEAMAYVRLCVACADAWLVAASLLFPLIDGTSVCVVLPVLWKLRLWVMRASSSRACDECK